MLLSIMSIRHLNIAKCLPLFSSSNERMKYREDYPTPQRNNSPSNIFKTRPCPWESVFLHFFTHVKRARSTLYFLLHSATFVSNLWTDRNHKTEGQNGYVHVCSLTEMKHLKGQRSSHPESGPRAHGLCPPPQEVRQTPGCAFSTS